MEHDKTRKPKGFSTGRQLLAVFIIVVIGSTFIHGSRYWRYRAVREASVPQRMSIWYLDRTADEEYRFVIYGLQDRELMHQTLTQTLNIESTREPGVYDVRIEVEYMYEGSEIIRFRLEYNREASLVHVQVTDGPGPLDLMSHIPDEDGTIRATLMEVLERYRDEGGES